jgi:predicted  nucleic acid-binding Zn-ribbon protein
MKDIRSLLLVLLSVGLVATWIYHFYDKANYSQRIAGSSVADSTAIADNIRDSLQKAYTATINDRDFKLDSSRNTSDSLRILLTSRISEINKLKGEISSILKNPNSTALQLKEARKKMTELEEKVEQLRYQNSSMETEKQTLNTRLDQLNSDVVNLEQGIRRLDDENKVLTEKIKQASVFMASTLHFTAIDIRETKEQETAQSKKADKFVASFILQNNLNQYLNAEVFVVITEPDGRVLQNSAWDSGMFDTKSEGRKSFTRMIKFDYEKGEQKRLIFSLDTDSFQKGTYKLQVWHQGILIGETSRTLH